MPLPAAHLIIREPGRIALSVPLRDSLKIGRNEQCDIILVDSQVSRNHAQITASNNAWIIQDKGSRHGVNVNGIRTVSHALSPGDRIQIGNVLLLYIEGNASPEVVHQAVTELLPPQKGAPDERRLALLYEVTRAIDAITLNGENEIIGRLLETVCDVLGAERALVGLVDFAGSLKRMGFAKDGASAEDVVISRAVLDATLTKKQSLILRNAGDLSTPHTLVREHILSAMAVPLISGQRVLGLLYVDTREKADRFVRSDLDFLAALGHLISVALEGADRWRRMQELAKSAGVEDDEILGNSEPMKRLKAQIQKYAPSPAPVLIHGESGTGKELAARRLHALSPRANRPFVTLNCAAMPETMIESELFGYEKGAFTGALKDKKGKFELADKGTLFLDEIGDLSPAAQAKVLRAIQEGEIQRVGSERTLRVDVRILAATHKDLRKEAGAGRFREDLFYRLDVLELLTPPLRDRGNDVELLSLSLLRSAAANLNKKIEGFSPAALEALRRYPWPGNVRELRNEMERAATNAESAWVELNDLSARLGEKPERSAGSGEKKTLAEKFSMLEPTERQLLEEALREARGNMAEAARLLGITWIMMKRRVERFGLRAKDERSGD